MSASERWLAWLVGVLFLVTPLKAASAHWLPEAHTVIVQAEPESAAILIRWSAASGSHTQGVLGRAYSGRTVATAQRALEDIAQRNALAGIIAEIDGEPVHWKSVRTKVSLGKGVVGRVHAAVLAIPEWPAGARTLRVTLHGRNGRQQIRWRDRSDHRVNSDVAVETWSSGKDEIVLRWPAAPPRAKDGHERVVKESEKQ